jgi:hypothetical protein
MARKINKRSARNFWPPDNKWATRISSYGKGPALRLVLAPFSVEAARALTSQDDDNKEAAN